MSAGRTGDDSENSECWKDDVAEVVLHKQKLGFGLDFRQLPDGVGWRATGAEDAGWRVDGYDDLHSLPWQIVVEFEGKHGMSAQEMKKELQDSKETVKLKFRKQRAVSLARGTETKIGLKFARFPDGVIKVASTTEGSAAHLSNAFARGQVVYKIQINDDVEYVFRAGETDVSPEGKSAEDISKRLEDTSAKNVYITVGNRPEISSKYQWNDSDTTFVGTFKGVDEFLDGIEGQIGLPFADIELGMKLELATGLCSDEEKFTASNCPGCEFIPEAEYAFVASHEGLDSKFHDKVPGYRDSTSRRRIFVPLKIFLYATCARTLNEDSRDIQASFGGPIPTELEQVVLVVLLRRVREALLTKDALKEAAKKRPSLEALKNLAEKEDGEEKLKALRAVILKVLKEQSLDNSHDSQYGLPQFKDVAEAVVEAFNKDKTDGDALNECISTDLLKALALQAREQLRDAHLFREEVLGLRLYTGPLFVKMNGALRGGDSGPLRGKKTYTNTIFAANSGMVKLSKVTPIPPGRRVYRGLSGIELPEKFWTNDRQGVRGGVEMAFLSTTTARNVAIDYSSQASLSRMPFIFEIEVGAIDKGAALSFLSQFPDEEEILMPPRSFLETVIATERMGDGRAAYWVVIDEEGYRDGGACQVIGEPKKTTLDKDEAEQVEGAKLDGKELPVWCIPVRINCNVQNFDIEKFTKARKTLLLSTVDQAIMEVNEELSRKENDSAYLDLAKRSHDLKFAKAPQVQIVALASDYHVSKEETDNPGLLSQLIDRLGGELGCDLLLVDEQIDLRVIRFGNSEVAEAAGGDWAGVGSEPSSQCGKAKDGKTIEAAKKAPPRVALLVMSEAAGRSERVKEFCESWIGARTPVIVVLSPNYPVKALDSTGMSWLQNCDRVDLRAPEKRDMVIQTELIPRVRKRALLTRYKRKPEFYLLELIKSEIQRTREIFNSFEPGWFHDDFNFTMSMQEALNLRSTAIAKLNLYISEPARGLRWVCDIPQRTCFRLFVGNKRRQMAEAKDGGDLRKVRDSAAELCAMTHVARGRQGLEKLVPDSCHQELFAWSPLMLAAADGNTEAVRLLCAAKVQVDRQDAHGVTALFLASELGCVRVVEVLLDAKGDPLSVNNQGTTGFVRAAENGHLKVLKRLYENHKAVLNRANYVKYTPLMAAARYGHPEVVQWLLENNANVNDVTADTEHSALTQATENTEHCALTQVPIKGLDIVELLLDDNADPNHSTRNGLTPLIISILSQNVDRVRLLLARGADPVGSNARGAGPVGSDGFGPLRLAEALKEAAKTARRGKEPEANEDAKESQAKEVPSAEWISEDVRKAFASWSRDPIQYVPEDENTAASLVTELEAAQKSKRQQKLASWGWEDVKSFLEELGPSFATAAAVVKQYQIDGEDLQEYLELPRTVNPLYISHEEGGLGLVEVQVRKLKRQLNKGAQARKH